MTDILQMDWSKIRKLSLDEAHVVRVKAKGILFSYESKNEIYLAQQLLGKLNHHIKTINKADNECKLSLRKQLKEEKAIKQGMVAEIKQLKAKIAELEK